MTAVTPAFDPLIDACDGAALPVSEHWSGFGGAHGGLMVAALGRAMERAAGRPLRAIHAELLSGVKPGTLDVAARVDRAGRSVSYASSEGGQDGALRLRATAVLGAATDGPLGTSLVMTDRALAFPTVPAADETEEWTDWDGPALRTVRFKPASANRPLTGSGDADFCVWLSVAGDDAPLDPWRLITLCDAPAPGLYGLVEQPFAVPTVELSAQLLPASRAPVGRWVLARMRTVAAAEGWSVDDCELWDEAGQPLLVSRQTRRILG